MSRHDCTLRNAKAFLQEWSQRKRCFSAQELATLLFLCATLAMSALAQQPVLTSRNDTTRSGANSNEVLLAPSNVSSGSFGLLFGVGVDYQVLAQPLYVPNVTITTGQYQGVHNVIYVVTQMDSVYAIDADTSSGGVGEILWSESVLAPGAVPATGKYLPCGDGQGFLYEGIVGTPVISLTQNGGTNGGTMYLDAKSVLNGQVRHDLHALNIADGSEQTGLGSPVEISAMSESEKGNVVNFDPLHQKNRPGALLLNGVLYLGYGSNGCNDSNTGWLLAYNASNLQEQLGAFNTSPDIGLTSIWQTGNGLAADEAGNLFVSTAENVQYGGQGYSNSVLKLTPDFPWNAPAPGEGYLNPNEPADFFTPWTVAYLNDHDLDISSVGPVILPDQSPGPPGCSEDPCHEVLASGKQGIVYVIDRDDMGEYVPGGQDNILQEFALFNKGILMSSPAYWNGLVYYTPDAAPLQSFQVTNGLLSPFAQTTGKYDGSHSPAVSANGNTDGIVWVLNGNLYAFDAISLRLLYASNQAGSRDKFPALAHFATPTIANGKVYVATQNSLEAFGLFHILTITGGNNQTAQVMNQLPQPLQVITENPYTGQPDPGVTVTFSDGNQGGTFNPTSAVTDSNGVASTTFTFPQTAGTYTLTVSATGFGNVTASETATPAAPQVLVAGDGGRQTGAAGTVLPIPLEVIAEDTYKNPVPGVTVNFTTHSGSVNPQSAVTNAKGIAQTYLQLPTSVGKVVVTASSQGLKSASFPEYAVAGPAASVTVTGGNNQSGQPGTTLPQSLTVLVADQYGNPVAGVGVTFSDGGAGGSFSDPNPATTNKSGVATQVYTLPPVAGAVTITATVNGVSNPGVFTETAQ